MIKKRDRAAGERFLREMGLGYQLRRAFMALHRRLKSAIAPHGTTPDQYVVLWVLSAYGELNQREIHELLYSDGNTVAAMLPRMERKGWIRRRPDPRDGRATRVRLTASGEGVRRRIFRVARRFHRQALTGFSDRERDALFASLLRVFSSLESNGRAR